MKRIIFTLLFIAVTLKSRSQDTSKADIKKMEITVGTFNTLNDRGKVTTNPVISGNWGEYYFENRYGYEASNSASINAGKRIFKKIRHAEIIPMAGIIFGSFKGLTAELQTSLDYSNWYFSTDNQYSFEYTDPKKSLYFNWTIARYKVNKHLQVGLSSLFDKRVNKCGVFDKGATAVFMINNWTLRFYAFNYQTESRYYWVALRYNFKIVI